MRRQAQDGRSISTGRDRRDALINISAGLAQPMECTEREKIAAARHELGHAVAAHFYKPDHAHVRLTITKRRESYGHRAFGAGGVVRYRSHLPADIRHSLGSLACERVFYGENSIGVTGDLRMATNVAAPA